MDQYNSYSELVYNIPTLIKLMEDDSVKKIKLSDNFFKANEPLLSNGFSHKYMYFSDKFLHGKSFMLGIDFKKITYYYENDKKTGMKKISKKIEIEKKKPLF